jgi:hypothetical protein
MNEARMKNQVQVSTLPPLRRLLTVRQLAERYSCWTEPAIRDLILHSRDRLNSRGEKVSGNGLDEAIVRVGRKVLIDEPKFIEIIAERSKRARTTVVHGGNAGEARRPRSRSRGRARARDARAG